MLGLGTGRWGAALVWERREKSGQSNVTPRNVMVELCSRTLWHGKERDRKGMVPGREVEVRCYHVRRCQVSAWSSNVVAL